MIACSCFDKTHKYFHINIASNSAENFVAIRRKQYHGVHVKSEFMSAYKLHE